MKVSVCAAKASAEDLWCELTDIFPIRFFSNGTLVGTKEGKLEPSELAELIVKHFSPAN